MKSRAKSWAEIMDGTTNEAEILQREQRDKIYNKIYSVFEEIVDITTLPEECLIAPSIDDIIHVIKTYLES